MLSPELQLSQSQQEALEIFTQSESNVFLSGAAGSGKSFLISKYLRDKDTRKDFPVLASTGAAAVLVGGRTFHSFFGLGLMQGQAHEIIERSVSNRHVRYRLRKAKAIVIDEISMIPGPVLDIAEVICRRLLDENRSWGGLRIISIGDFAQLPPIARGQKFPPWAFLSSSWERACFHPIILDENMRSKADTFSHFLLQMREGTISDEVEEILNERYGPPFDFQGTQLFSKRMEAEDFNARKLAGLSENLVSIPTKYSGHENYIEALKKNAPISECLHIKIGSKVMIRINDPLLRYVNGSTGIVLAIKEDEITVGLGEQQRPFEFEKVAFSYLDGNGDVKATAQNFPLQLAWASTIHKAQGMTLDEVAVSLQGLWEPGQAYVAASRVRSLENLWIRDWSKKSIFCDPLVQRFYQEGCSYSFRESLGMDDTGMDF